MTSTTTEEVSTLANQQQELLLACARGDVKYLGEYVISGRDIEGIKGLHGRNVLHYCVLDPKSKNVYPVDSIFEQRDRLKCARIIMKTANHLIERPDDHGLSPLHLAVIKNDVDFIRTMLEFNPFMGVKTAKRTVTTSDSEYGPFGVTGRTPIHLATIYECVDSLKVLLQADVSPAINLLDDQGAAAVHYAVQLPSPGEEMILDLLISKGHAELNITDLHGRSALIWAATIGATNAVDTLLRLGAKLNLKDECGLTALHCAASRGHASSVQCILDWIRVANMDDLSRMGTFRDVVDRDGCTPVFYSVTLGHTEVTKALLNAGARVDVSDSKGRTLAHCLARAQTVQTEDCKHKLTNHLSQLANAGLDLWKANKAGATPLHEACLLLNVTFVNELCKDNRFQELVNQKDSQGHTPLHLAVAASWSGDPTGMKLCALLLKHGANVNTMTQLPHGGAVTALDLAIMNESEEGIHEGPMHRLLIHYGAKTVDGLLKDKTEEAVEQQLLGSRQRSKSPDVFEVDARPIGDSRGFSVDSRLRDPPDSLADETRATNIDKHAYKLNAVVDKSTNTKAGDEKQTVSHRHLVDTVSARTKELISRGTQTSLDFQTNRMHESSSLNELSIRCTGPHSQHVVVCLPGDCGESGRKNKKPHVKTSHISQKMMSKMAAKKISGNSLKGRDANRSAATHITNTETSNLCTSRGNRRVVTSRSRSHQPKATGKHTDEVSKSRPIPNQYDLLCIDKSIPAILDRYMHRGTQDLSHLTRNSKINKPALSPYLIPLVPTVSSVSRQWAPSVIRPDLHHTRSARKYANSTRQTGRDKSSDNKYVPRDIETQGSSASSCSHQRHCVHQSKKTEYDRLLTQLAELNNQLRFTPSSRKPRPDGRAKDAFEQIHTTASQRVQTSAMGEQLSQVG
ncbi:unnamed protein product [Dicrocoelium dendriticum]|nr:unnamed protein product [Dicrocoelium dendriticum]